MKKSRKSCAVNVGRWVSYAAAGAGMAMAASNDAEAAILYSGTLNTHLWGSGKQTAQLKTLIADTHPGALVFGSLTHNISLGNPNGYPAGGGTGGTAWFKMLAGEAGKVAGFIGHISGSVGSGFPYASRLAAGANIAGQPFLTPGARAYMNAFSYAHNSQWVHNVLGFLGFQFNTGAGVEYGWARVQMRNGASAGMTLIDYAYGTPGQAIVAGQEATPEPASLALFAMGALGLFAIRAAAKKKVA